MIDYPAMRAVAAIIQTGSFEKAARVLNVTPSAVSQRVKQLEDRLGLVLIVRGTPCTATEKGAWLCRHMEHVGMLEDALFQQLPGLAGSEPQRVTLNIATNADSLGTWFIEALARFTRETGYLVDVAVDDQDHTAEWLQRGRVLAAVTGLSKPVSGCRRTPLGILRYRATASPDFLSRYCPDGVTADALANAPALVFNQKDRLQGQWLRENIGADLVHPSHWLPSTHAFVDAALAGIGWGMNPDMLVKEHLAAGRLVELLPDTPVDIALDWQATRLSGQPLEALTRHVVAVARKMLLPSPEGRT
jgi:LysR family transcriptional regulator, chromosome initiation inhibitor